MCWGGMPAHTHTNSHTHTHTHTHTKTTTHMCACVRFKEGCQSRDRAVRLPMQPCGLQSPGWDWPRQQGDRWIQRRFKFTLNPNLNVTSKTTTLAQHCCFPWFNNFVIGAPAVTAQPTVVGWRWILVTYRVLLPWPGTASPLDVNTSYSTHDMNAVSL